MEYVEIDGYQKFDSEKNYGFFGYPSAMTHIAINNDDADGLKKMLDAGWITRDSKTFDNISMGDLCRRKNAMKCAALFA